MASPLLLSLKPLALREHLLNRLRRMLILYSQKRERKGWRDRRLTARRNGEDLGDKESERERQREREREREKEKGPHT